MFLEQNNVFYNFQFGFRNNHSTNHVLVNITKMSLTKISSLVESTLIQKVFDKVNHEIL